MDRRKPQMNTFFVQTVLTSSPLFIKLCNSATLRTWGQSVYCIFAYVWRSSVFLRSHMGQSPVSTVSHNSQRLPHWCPTSLPSGESYLNIMLSSPAPFRTSCYFLASCPINLSTPAPQQQISLSDMKATFIIIPRSNTVVTGFTAGDAGAHNQNKMPSWLCPDIKYLIMGDLSDMLQCFFYMFIKRKRLCEHLCKLTAE